MTNFLQKLGTTLRGLGLTDGRRMLTIGATVAGALVLISVLIFTVSRCSIPDWMKGPPKSGTVVSKRYEEPRHYEEWDSCKHQYPVTRTRTDFDGNVETYTEMECQGGYVEKFDDEDWKLLLESCKTNDDGTKGKCRKGWREVTREAYRASQVGSHYDGKGNV